MTTTLPIKIVTLTHGFVMVGHVERCNKSIRLHDSSVIRDGMNGDGLGYGYGFGDGFGRGDGYGHGDGGGRGYGSGREQGHGDG